MSLTCVYLIAALVMDNVLVDKDQQVVTHESEFFSTPHNLNVRPYLLVAIDGILTFDNQDTTISQNPAELDETILQE